MGEENMKNTSVRSMMVAPVKNTSVRWMMIAPVLLVVWVVGMIDKIGVSVIATNKSFLSEMHLETNHALVGSLVSALLFSYGIGFFIWGALVQRFGPKKSAISGLLLWALSTMLAATAQSFEWLFISRITLGFAEACLWPVSHTLTARWFPLNERGRAKSIWANGTNIGPAISGFLVIAVINAFEWRGVFWFLTALALVICIPLLIFFIKDDPKQDKRVSQNEIDLILSEQLHIEENEENHSGKKGSLLLVIIANSACQLGFFGFATWFPSYLAITKHFDQKSMSSYMLLAYGLSLITMIILGRIIDKTNRKAIWNIWAYIGAGLLLLIAGQSSSAVAAALCVALAICLIGGVTTLVSQGLLHSITPTPQMGRNSGIMQGSSSTIAAFGPTIMGALLTLGGGQYGFAFAFLIVVFLIGAVSSMILNRQGY